MHCTAHVAGVAEMRNADEILVEKKTEGKLPWLEREDNIKIDLKEINSEFVD
jgi:hypothetical protein